MIDPLENPPERFTAHRAKMSPRLSRLYTWLQANSVGLTDFSTDRCVESAMPTLVALQSQLDDLRARAPALYLDHLAADLACLMRRTPAARVSKGG